jgi:hypothetical protein
MVIVIHIGVHLRGSFMMVVIHIGVHLGVHLSRLLLLGVHLWCLVIHIGGLFWIFGYFVGVRSDNLFFGVCWLAFVIVRSQV